MMYTYQNPVLRGYHPDPTIIRVGDDFYMGTSTFEFSPGVPIYHSKNLVNWELINYCLIDDEQLPLAGSRNSGGIFAPTIRYHDGVFYMITTNITCGGNFIVHTEDIRGKWSKPSRIAHRGIDPSLLFDDDGKVYFCGTAQMSMTQAGIGLAEINPMTGDLLSEVKIISSGVGGKFPEAPHLYKISGWYYLMLAEGGTEYGHMETMLRARTPHGPYEPCPHNPILSHRDYMGSPIQAVGHADIVEDQNGNWWMVCLGIRPLGYAMLHNLGRETFLSPMRWDAEGWPVVGDQGRIALEMKGPLPDEPQPVSVDFADNFSENTLNLHWNHVRNCIQNRYQLMQPGLRLKAKTETLNDETPTLVAIRQQAVDMRIEATLFSALEGKHPMAGATAYYNKDYHYEIYATIEHGHAYVVLAKHVHDIHHIAAKQEIDYSGAIDFAIDADVNSYAFNYRLPGGEWTLLGTGVTAGLCTEGTMSMTFTGTYVGVFASDTYVDCSAFSARETSREILAKPHAS